MTRTAVVIPAYQAEETLQSCLDAIMAAGVARDDILVVDDGSTDRTGEIARSAGVRLIRNERSQRPARARNIGVAHTDANTDLILMFDADVVVHPKGPARLLAAFADPGVWAAFGSYDSSPAAPSVVSRYRNLLHYFTHQTAPPEAETFWSGFGAVRRDRFTALGGLETAWENIEDVEFGLRLRAAGGRIRLERAALCTHLKDWTFRSMMRTDLWGRAVPWTRLLRQGRMPPGTLNDGSGHRLSAGLVLLVLAALVCAPFWPQALWIAAAGGLGFLAVNRAFLAELRRIGGLKLAVCAVPFHAAHYLAAVAGYAYARLTPVPDAPPASLRSSRSPSPPG